MSSSSYVTEPFMAVLEGNVYRLTLNAPATRNALSTVIMEGLLSAVDSSVKDGARGLLLEHTGSVFCSGVDLKERSAMPRTPEHHSRLLGSVLKALWNYHGFIMCSVKGKVRGGGLGLLACSDVVICGPDADFAFSEVRLGVMPALIGSFCLAISSARRLGPWLLSGERFGAEEAMQLGLVTRISKDVASTSKVELDALLRGAPESQKSTKQLIRALRSCDPMQTLPLMQKLSSGSFATPEAMEGQSAFRERRPAAWSRSATGAA